MSAVEDTRKLIQDFLAPELRTISARLDALEKRIDGVDKRLDGVDKRLDGIDRRFEDLERRAERRHDEVLAAIARMSEISMLRERVTRLESAGSPHQ